MSYWNSKTDLGRPVPPLEARPNHTHKITIPGTKFLAYTETASRADKLAKQLAKTYVPARSGFTRRSKCVPVITELKKVEA